ncbi:recombination protein RecR [Candidatus Babeliales bacterium]|nr:recombination protein RecR [Candidatus Babeliales bacterium]
MTRQLLSLQKLVGQLQKIPYLASKNIYKVVGYFLEASVEDIEKLCKVLREAKENVDACACCFNWAEKNQKCSICQNSSRKQDIICVVETWHDLMAIERAQEYKGLYHVLGGVLSPLNGIGPDDLRIKELLNRINKSTEEIIFGTNPTPEGETTASFIATKLPSHLLISKLASGVPTGSSLEFIDRVTIAKALSGRQPF